MRYQFFKISTTHPKNDQARLNAFIASHRIGTIEKNFVVAGDQSFWAFCLCYSDMPTTQRQPSGKVDYRDVLNQEDFSIFAKLRTLRKTLAGQEGVPAYALFTNDQLVEMVRNKIVDITGLGRINGVGKSRLKKYGDAFLKVLQQSFPDPPKSGAKDEADTN